MFISFEGIDFCGKSTQVELLKNYLLANKKEVEIIREPGGTEISEKIREMLLDKKNSGMVNEAEIFLFSASRAQLVREKIRPYLNAGIYVISDRFHDSTSAYQGFARGIPLGIVDHINKLAIGDVIPDLTFFIDIPVNVAEERKHNKPNTNLDRIELLNCDFYNKVREGYIYLTNTEKRFRKIDGTQSMDDIHRSIVSEINLYEKRR